MFSETQPNSAQSSFQSTIVEQRRSYFLLLYEDSCKLYSMRDTESLLRVVVCVLLVSFMAEGNVVVLLFVEAVGSPPTKSTLRLYPLFSFEKYPEIHVKAQELFERFFLSVLLPIRR